MAKTRPISRDPFTNRDSLRRSVIAQRAHLIRSEEEVAAEVRAVLGQLSAKWNLVLRRATRPGATATQLAEARRYADVMREAGVATQQAVRKAGEIVKQAFSQTVREEGYRFAAKLSPGGVTAELQASLHGLSSRAVAQAAISPIPGLDLFPSFSKMSSKAMLRMQQDVAEAIAEGWKVDDLARLWSRGAGAGRVANEADALARTSVMAASNQSFVEVVKSNPGTYQQSLRWNATFDIRTCPVCGSLHGKIFPIAKLPAMPAHFRCVLGDTKVLPGCVISASRARYRGDVVAITTKHGRGPTVTQNHPVLLPSGFSPAHRLKKGDYVARGFFGDGGGLGVVHAQDQPSTIREIFELASIRRSFRSPPVPTSAADFHGDAERFVSDVDVVDVGGELFYPGPAAVCEHLGEFGIGGAAVCKEPLLALGDVDLRLMALRFAAYGRVSCFREAASFFGGGVLHPNVHRLAAISLNDPDLAEPTDNYAAGDSVLLRECFDALTGSVTFDEITHIDRYFVDTHVYDLQTASGAYLADGVIVHNCRCHWSPVFVDEELNDLLETPAPYPAPAPAAAMGRTRDFEAWLRKQPKGHQLDFFGSEAKRNAWASRKLSLEQMVSPGGRVLPDADVRVFTQARRRP